MLPGENGLEPGSHFASRLLPLLDESWLKKLHCELSFCELSPLLDSSAMNASHWFSLAAQLLDEQNQYDSFILLQGTDTLAWTAGALDCLLTHFSPPLVLTASQLPLGSPNSDALANIQFALEQAVQLETGCFIAFAKQLLPAQATRKFDSQNLDAFTAVNQPLASKHFWPANGYLTAKQLRQLAGSFQPKLLRLPLIPSLNDAWLAQQLDGLDGLILEGLGSGNSPCLPLTFKRLTELHLTQGLVIGLTSQCWQGGVNQNYAASADLYQAGVVALGKMTPEYAEARLVCLLALNHFNIISAADLPLYWLND
ncbi:L-asparaginase 1 [Marinospirillum insulare]|uniref:L-asparaginase 1 n=2 Tax=Marinospirillum insulare TaxID=217169 RepID=A0ABQ5ZX12_9GAMM|nr:L-asparaginase 1 [Marinospirillum insulare]